MESMYFSTVKRARCLFGGGVGGVPVPTGMCGVCITSGLEARACVRACVRGLETIAGAGIGERRHDVDLPPSSPTDRTI